MECYECQSYFNTPPKKKQKQTTVSEQGQFYRKTILKAWVNCQNESRELKY